LRKLARIKPFQFENRLLIALDARWIKAFDGFPEFDVTIDSQNRLRLVSTQKIRSHGEK